MDFRTGRETIGDLLSCGRAFVVPRFQREYEWKLEQCKVFYNDLIKNIEWQNGELKSVEYFWGSILLIGDWDAKEKMTIIDGQQRLTTITIFLSALYDALKETGVDKIVLEKIWEKIIGTNEDGKPFTVLENISASPFFQNLIQTQKRDTDGPKTEEQTLIKQAFDYFRGELFKEDEIKNCFGGSFSYQDCLKAIRDQLLKGVVIRISTKNSETAGAIYENTNSKGLSLEPVDLIKNKIFMILDTTVPTDQADNLWKEIRKNLSGDGGNDYIPMPLFFRHFWNAFYSKSGTKDLDKRFKSLKQSDYLPFMKQMERMSGLYSRIVRNSAARAAYGKNDAFIVDALTNFNDVFGVVQTRIILLPLLSAYQEKRISRRQLKDILAFLQNFHFAFTGLCSGRGSKFYSKYIEYAEKIAAAKTKEEMGNILKEFKRKLDVVFPSKATFIDSFCKCLKFSKYKAGRYDGLTKYAVNQLENSYSKMDNRMDGSVEHIVNDDPNDELTWSIGNLILLEESINSSIPQSKSDYSQKKPYYENSSYAQMKKFIGETTSFGKDDILARANKLADYYYTKLLRRSSSIRPD